MNYKKTKYTCYYTNLAMSSAFSLPPILFVTFHNTYGISYTLLGTLVLTNFCTQLIIDLVFTFFAKHFNIHKTLKLMPLLTSIGLAIYALAPTFFPEKAFSGLFIGTVVFSVSAGLCEVLVSPTIAALPSDNPERDMSKLHSLYAYGVVGVVLLSSLFFKLFGTENWMYLTLFFAFLPIIACILYCTSPLPDLNFSHDHAKSDVGKKSKGILLCVACIFFGSAAENTMTNWISSYMENALGISKAIGDVLGLALFGILLGLGRSLYSKYGKNIANVLLFGMVGATACYIIAGTVSNPIVCMLACIFTGLCTSMLWPGTLILMEEKFPNPGVTAYALMAAGGDFGGSVSPQILGVVVDKVSESSFALELSNSLSLTPEQIGLKTGMLIASIFPILGVAVLLYIKKYFKKQKVL